jgi:hypothetical protein
MQHCAVLQSSTAALTLLIHGEGLLLGLQASQRGTTSKVPHAGTASEARAPPSREIKSRFHFTLNCGVCVCLLDLQSSHPCASMIEEIADGIVRAIPELIARDLQAKKKVKGSVWEASCELTQRSKLQRAAA